jgi:hypothetical protein
MTRWQQQGPGAVFEERENMKNRLIYGLLVLLLAGGCCSLQPPHVPVREAIYRSEVASTNRIALPLTAESRDFLLRFLRSGRNPAVESDATLVEPLAEQQYGQLLELLSRTECLAVTNLVADQRFSATATFKPWFPKHAVRQVIDAREDFVGTVQPYAFLDAQRKYWWIFYHRKSVLTFVMVTKPTATTIEK